MALLSLAPIPPALKPAKILEAIQDAYLGGAPMISAIARKALNYFQKSKPLTTELSQREIEVLKLLIEGHCAQRSFPYFNFTRTYF